MITFPKIKHSSRSLSSLKALLMLGVFSAGMCTAQASSPTVRFGLQPWPGLTIKTEVIGDVLESLGYKVEKKQVGTPLVLHSLATDNIDVALGAWSPGADYQVDPLVEEGKIVKLAVNLPSAISGLAVPSYVHEAGVTTMSDLNESAAKFDHTMYGIETGSSANKQLQDAIDSNRFNLGDWTLSSSSTAAMLTAVKRKISKDQWVVFYGWKPHWMNKTFDLYYVTSNDDFMLAAKESVVYTLANSNFPERNPNVARLLRQFEVSTETQTQWIYEYSYKEGNKSEISRDWIPSNLEVVRRWVEGVETASGKPAFPAVKAAFD